MSDLSADILELIGGPVPGQPGEPESRPTASPAPATGLPATVSADQLAFVLGITGRNVNEAARRGEAVRLAPGKFDLAKSVQGYMAARTAKRGGLATEKERLARAQADLAESKAAEMRGEMVPAAAVAATWAAMLADIRAALLAVPERAASRAGLDRATVEILAGEIRDTLETLADAEPPRT